VALIKCLAAAHSATQLNKRPVGERWRASPEIVAVANGEDTLQIDVTLIDT
jgi:hypothetical protein